jgi:hypothetical protein
MDPRSLRPGEPGDVAAIDLATTLGFSQIIAPAPRLLCVSGSMSSVR